MPQAGLRMQVDPKSKADVILDELRLNDPSLLRHLKEICCERGAFVRESQLKSSEARLVVSGNRGIITVNPNEANLGRKRFSIAHELGHFELHRADQGSWVCGIGEMNDWTRLPEREREANEFAAEILMPERFIRPELATDRPDFAYFKSLATKYQVSLSALLSRFIELTDEACAVIFSRSGTITSFWKSRLLEKQRYWIPAALPESLSDGKSQVEAGVWFQLPSWLRGERVIEQSEYFKKFDLGITLLWIPEGRLIRY